MIRLVLVLALVFATLSITETRRHNCVMEGNAGCTLLPWSGHPALPEVIEGPDYGR